jgi:carbamoyl-phosphate synthase large subunit
MGYKILATGGTARFLQERGVPATRVNKLREGSPNIVDMIRQGEVQFLINTLTKGKKPERDGFRMRREAVENGVVALTSLDTAKAMLMAMESIIMTAMPLEDPSGESKDETGSLVTKVSEPTREVPIHA